jgi:hypothetical protein
MGLIPICRQNVLYWTDLERSMGHPRVWFKTWTHTQKYLGRVCEDPQVEKWPRTCAYQVQNLTGTQTLRISLPSLHISSVEPNKKNMTERIMANRSGKSATIFTKNLMAILKKCGGHIPSKIVVLMSWHRCMHAATPNNITSNNLYGFLSPSF